MPASVAVAAAVAGVLAGPPEHIVDRCHRAPLSMPGVVLLSTIGVVDGCCHMLSLGGVGYT